MKIIIAITDSHCARCGAEFISNGFSLGYGTRKDGTRVCFECCAVLDRADMEATGRATMYLSWEGEIKGYVLTNWPGTLRISPFRVRKGRHNIARTRYDFWFSVSGQPWYGTQLRREYTDRALSQSQGGQVMARHGYKFAVAWIADNDEPDDTAVESVKGYISVGLVADMFGKTVLVVATDVVNYRNIAIFTHKQGGSI